MSLPTIVDVAELAGTATATVSRVLNGSGYVSAARRRAVMDAIAKLGYVPHGSAQSLRLNRSRVLAVIVGDLANPSSVSLINSIQTYAAERDYTTLFASVPYAGTQSEQDLLKEFLRQRPAGMILATLRTTPSDESLRKIADSGVPLALVGRGIEHSRIDSISANYYRGGEIITQHLLDLGHRRIAFLGAQMSERDQIGRLRGYLDAIERAGIRVRPSWVIGADDGVSGPHYPTYLAGYQAAKRLIQLSARPTAIVARNDITAVGAIQALHDAGLRVPDDISLTGFDNMPLAASIAPALTTMSQPTDEAGRLAAEFLIARLERPQESIPSRTIVLECNLIVRASTARVSTGAVEPAE